MLQHNFEDVLKSEENDTTLTKDIRKIIKHNLEIYYACSASGEISLVMNMANFVDPHFKADYLNEDELALVKEKIAIDIDVMDVMDHNSQEDTNEGQQQDQRNADVVSCEEQQ